MASLETAILAELREVANNKSLRKNDMQEWSTGKLTEHPGEVIIDLPRHSVQVSILKERDKRKKD